MKPASFTNRSTLVAILAVFIGDHCAAAEQATPSRIAAVVVYADRAMVTRTAKLNVAQGEQRILLGPLPAGVLEDSVTAAIRTGPARIVGIELQRQTLGEPQDEKIRVLQREVEQLTDKQRELANRMENDRKQLDFADKLQVYQVDKASKELLLQDPKTEVWEKVLKFLEKTRTEKLADILETEVQGRELRRQLDVKSADLGQLRSVHPTETRPIVLHLSAAQAGESTVELRYVICGAHWEPSYEARADNAAKEVELTYFGTASQTTGEDWPEVDLWFSTAQPGLGAQPVQLKPIKLAADEIIAKAKEESPPVVAGGGGSAGGGAVGVTPSIPGGLGGKFGGWVTANVASTGPSALYKVPRLQSVPSANRPQRITISSERFKASFGYVAVPKTQPHVFLRAQLTNNTDAHLVAGPVSVFQDGDFIGKSRLPDVAPKQEFPVYLGADEQFRVQRERLADRTRESFLGKKLVLTQSFRITLENYSGKPQTVTVYDQKPVSRDDKIDVRNFKSDLAPRQIKEESGELEWRAELKQGEKRAIEFGYEVIFGEEIASQPNAREVINKIVSRF